MIEQTQIQEIDPNEINFDKGATNVRGGHNDDAVQEYAQALLRGEHDKFPPVDLFYDGEYYWIGDGFLRVRAYVSIGGDHKIKARIHQGGKLDALWFAIGANQSHGLPRTNEDKRRAVKAALKHPNGASMSNNQIAKYIGVHHVTVGKIREELELSCEIHKIESRTVQRGDQVYAQNTANIGETPSSELCQANKPRPWEHNHQQEWDGEKVMLMDPQPHTIRATRRRIGKPKKRDEYDVNCMKFELSITDAQTAANQMRRALEFNEEFCKTKKPAEYMRKLAYYFVEIFNLD